MQKLTPVLVGARYFSAVYRGCRVQHRCARRGNRHPGREAVHGHGPADLNLRTFDGSIQMKSWDRNEVLVEIERRGPDEQTAKALVVNTSQDGNRIVVDVPEPRDRRDGIHIGSWQSPSVSLVVTAPRKVTVDARTGDGSISADDLTGTVALNSGDGSIQVQRVEGNLRARTGDGSISTDRRSRPRRSRFRRWLGRGARVDSSRSMSEPAMAPCASTSSTAAC